MDVSDGTWLRDVRLGDRPREPAVVLVTLPLLEGKPAKFFRTEPCQGPFVIDAERATDVGLLGCGVPDVCALLLSLLLLLSPSSLAISVMRDDMTLGARPESKRGTNGDGKGWSSPGDADQSLWP